MTLATDIQGLKARQVLALGNAPGNGAKKSRALNGRNRISLSHVAGICAALSGLDSIIGLLPGALPRAITLRPCRAEEGTVRV